MHIQFVDQNQARTRLLPLTYTRPIADLRVGILKISEKWVQTLGATKVGFDTVDYLNKKFPKSQNAEIFIYNGVLPNPQLLKAIGQLMPKTQLLHNNEVIVSNAPLVHCENTVQYSDELNLVRFPWDIFSQNGREIAADYQLLTDGRTSEKVLDPHTIVYGEQVFVEKGVKIRAAVLNAENGPIYIGADAEICEGALIKGPFAIGEHSVVNMGAKIKGDTTIGPHCKVGGEISNSVIQGYSNKGHDGFLGNSVLGEWCNLGADTNNSNLKNNYANVKMWDFETARFKDTGLQFCGLIMGDHSKCGINTMFNTGTTVGVSSNIFGEGFPRNIVPSFAWGGASGFSTYRLDKAYEVADLVMSRRKITLDDIEKDILQYVFDQTNDHRIWDKKK